MDLSDSPALRYLLYTGDDPCAEIRLFYEATSKHEIQVGKSPLDLIHSNKLRECALLELRKIARRYAIAAISGPRRSCREKE